jgi:hypothetical protein
MRRNRRGNRYQIDKMYILSYIAKARTLLSIGHLVRARASGLRLSGPIADATIGKVESPMKMMRLAISILLTILAAKSWALAQDTVGVDTQGLTSLASSISSGSYGAGFYGPGLTGPGSYGPRSYGPGSYGPGTGAYTGPPTPFTYFTQGGPAAGGVAVPNAPSQ